MAIIEDGGMPETDEHSEICKSCGTKIPEGMVGCPACGAGAIPKLKLVGKDGELSSLVDLDFGRAFASKLCGDESKYFDNINFFLKRRDDKWMLKPMTRAKNKVFLNSSEVLEESEIHSGDRISLNDKAAFIDVSLV